MNVPDPAVISCCRPIFAAAVPLPVLAVPGGELAFPDWCQ